MKTQNEGYKFPSLLQSQRNLESQLRGIYLGEGGGERQGLGGRIYCRLRTVTFISICVCIKALVHTVRCHGDGPPSQSLSHTCLEVARIH